MLQVVEVTESISPTLVDITGGAPELNEFLKPFISELREVGASVQVRTNLSVMEEPGLTSYPAFFARNKVGLAASLPCYLEENVCKMRGSECFSKSISVLRRLNSLGYGIEKELPLDLVFNPTDGTSLPPGQEALEREYKREMKRRYGVTFDRLLSLANVPIGRSKEELHENGQEEKYMALLAKSFNPGTVHGLMCRRQVNVGWDGQLYDCDFNQALGLGVSLEVSQHIDDFLEGQISRRRIVTGDHCFACTAGEGSSCGGAITS